MKSHSLTYSLTPDFYKMNRDAIELAILRYDQERDKAELREDKLQRMTPTWGDVEALEAERIELFARAQKGSRRIKNKTTAEDFVEVQEYIRQIEYSKSRTCFWFVTINPKPGTPIKVLHDKIVKMLDRPEIIDCLWTYEIREKPDKGLHAHICFQTAQIMDSNFVNRKIKRLFVPSICGNNKHVHVKWPDSQSEYEVAKEYITKRNVAKSKKAADTATVAWRQTQGILPEYTEDHLLVWSSLKEAEPSGEVIMLT